MHEVDALRTENAALRAQVTQLIESLAKLNDIRGNRMPPSKTVVVEIPGDALHIVLGEAADGRKIP